MAFLIAPNLAATLPLNHNNNPFSGLSQDI
jgi:hypothetical protein